MLADVERAQRRRRRGARSPRRHARLRHVRNRLGVPDRRPRSRLPAQVPGRPAPARRPQLVRGRRPGARRHARGRARSSCPSTTPGLDLRVARLEELVVVSRDADACARRPSRSRRSPTAPLILYDAQYGAARPDAPAARRPRAAGRRDAAAGDRGGGNRGRGRARPPWARRHDRAPGRDQPPGRPRPALRLVRGAALRHVRVHRPQRRAALTCRPRLRRDRRAPARAGGRSGPVRARARPRADG